MQRKKKFINKIRKILNLSLKNSFAGKLTQIVFRSMKLCEEGDKKTFPKCMCKDGKTEFHIKDDLKAKIMA